MEEKDRIFRREQKRRLAELQKKFRKKWDALEMLVSEDEENVAFIAARGEKRYFYETKDGKLTLLQKVKNCLLKAAFSMILPIFANRLTII